MDIVLLILVGCYIAWQVQRAVAKRRAARKPVAAQPPAPTPPQISVTQEFESVINPAYQASAGWPAYASEFFPLMGTVTSAEISGHVIATYTAPGKPDYDTVASVRTGEDVELAQYGPHGDLGHAVFTVAENVLARVRDGVPEGYPALPTYLTVKLRVTLTGLPPRY